MNLNSKSRRAIATRSTLRSLPSALSLLDQTTSALKTKTLVLAALRATLTSCVASSYQQPIPSNIEKAARSAGFAASSSSRSITHSASFSAASYAISSAAKLTSYTSTTFLNADSAINFSADAAAHSELSTHASLSSQKAQSVRQSADSSMRSAVDADGFLSSTEEEEDLFKQPLWPTKQTVASLLVSWSEFENRYSENSIWCFWSTWYRKMLLGTPVEWELQRRVALIEDAIWDAGPEAVAKEIARIQAKFELEQENASLKEQLSAQQQALASAPQIGDNGGPPLDNPVPTAFKQDLVLIWSEVEKLEEEIAKPEPSPTVLERIAKSLLEIAQRIAAYCGATLDVMVKEGAKTIGKAGGGLFVAEYIKPGSIEAVAKAIGKFIATLAN